LYVETIDVTGLQDNSLTYIAPEAVQKALIDSLGKRIFFVSPNQIEKQVKTEFPFAQEVYASKRIPDTLVVRIVERDPVLTVRFVDVTHMFSSSLDVEPDSDMLIDGEGIVLSTCTASLEFCSDHPLCLVTQPWGTLTPGDTYFFSELESVVEMQALLQKLGIEARAFAVPMKDTIVVMFEDGTRAIFSVGTPISQQVNLLEYTKENLALKGKKYKELDFRYEQPVMRVDKYTDWVTE